MRLRPSQRLWLPISACAVGAVSMFGFLTVAGPLDPPAGPVAPTHKTLTEVEPRVAINAANTPGDNDATPSLFKITQPGSYYLTGNITGVAGKHGVEFAASGVTLDLNGFDLAGIAGMGAFDGVSVSIFSLTNITVRNGSVRSWCDEGVDLGTFGASNSRVEGVLASDNISTGIRIGNGCTASSCSAYSNHGSGISTGVACIMADCSTRVNFGDGILCSTACVIRGNNCAANGNAANDGAGIHATGSDNRIEGNTCTGADRGIDVDLSGNIIIKNTCSGNTTDWTIVANNVVGPILDRRAPASAAINGFSAPDSTGSTHPNANFSY